MAQPNPIRLIMMRRLLLFLTCWFGGSILAFLAMNVVAGLYGISDFNYLQEQLLKGNYLEHVNSIKVVSLVLHLFSYAIPALVFAYIIRRKQFASYLYLTKGSTLLNFVLVILLAVLSYPTAMIIYKLNTMLVPNSWIATDTLKLQELMMSMDSISDLLLNLLLFGLIAGVGEELLFRGGIQKVVSQYFQNMHMGIWTTGLIFSLTHFQPEGFIPRFLLGVLLGYLFVWTGTLWASILAHITFNGMQVLLIYFVGVTAEDPLNTSFSESINLYTIISMVLFIFVCYGLWHINRKKFPEWAKQYTQIFIKTQQ